MKNNNKTKQKLRKHSTKTNKKIHENCDNNFFTSKINLDIETICKNIYEKKIDNRATGAKKFPNQFP